MKIAGKQRFLSQIAALPAAMRAEIQKALVVSAEETNDLQQRFAPVKDGKLQRSIGYVLGDEAPEGAGLSTAPAKGSTDLTVTMFAGDASTIVENSRGVQFQNAVLQEFGTKKMTRNPFFFPGFRIGKKRAKPRLARAVSAGAKKAFRK